MVRLTRSGLAVAALVLSALPAVAQYEIQKPRDKWQTPGEIRKPTGPWQKPGEIQVPKGIQAIRTEEARCTQRFLVGSDALFEFDKATLTPDAEETLKALVPLLAKAGKHPATVEGHTDAKGTDAYNQTLSEKRAETVKDWLAAHGALPAATSTKGWGKRRPVAPNTKPDGADDPAGRQKNRRVEVVLDLCNKQG
ncbi:MAG TPA: OmpA family protein [Thermoanaerobaculia bacterium]|jgi:outer membrane protein OmpA-like peptidoglycan-associated protein|nr:OmpA family protein [Thermoanaerobaculia bacterium]